MNRKINSIQKPLVLLFLLCLFPMGALAQSIVKGIVSDEAGEPVIGATVVTKLANPLSAPPSKYKEAMRGRLPISTVTTA